MHIGFSLKQKKKNPSSQIATTDSSLLTDLQLTKQQIDTLLIHLNYQTDPDLIDSYAYQLKGAYLKYRFLLHQIEQNS